MQVVLKSSFADSLEECVRRFLILKEAVEEKGLRF